MVNNKKWITLYVSIIALWALVLGTTLRSWIVGAEALVDNVDISTYTFPMLAFNLIFVGISMFIFVVYLLFYFVAVRRQEKAIRNVKLRASAVVNGIGGGNGNGHGTDGISVHQEDLCSIIIPACNEESVIKNTILNCLQQTYNNIEIIIVCHNCRDRTYDQCKEVSDRRVHAVELRTEKAGKGIALNYGVKESKGKYLLILDGDGKLNSGFIEDALPLLQDNYAAVQGRYIPSNRNYNFITRMLAIEGDLWSTPFMTLRSLLTGRTPLGGTGYIIKSDILSAVGGFANHLVDDYELSFRLLRNKHRIAFAPLSINYDEKPATFDIMIKQRARWLRGFLNLMKFRVAEPRDVIGSILSVNSVSAFTGLALLLVAGYSTIHYLIFHYYPFNYSYIPLDIWAGMTLAFFGMHTASLVRQYGKSGLKYAALLPIYLPFSNYYLIVALKAFFVKSWAETKTIHGFILEKAIKAKIPLAKSG